MATFFSSSTNQRDILPTLYLRDSEPSVNGSMMFLNYSSSGPYTDMLAGNTQSQQNCINLPVPTTLISQNSSSGPPDMIAWRDGRNVDMLMQTIGGSMNSGNDLVRPSVTDDPQMALRAQLGIQSGLNFSLQQSNVSAVQCQGLSLSLSTQMPVPSFHYRPANPEISVLSSHQSDSGNGVSCRDDNPRNKPMNMNPSPYGLSNLASTIPNSKYLKAAQQLLDEVVNVRKALKNKPDKSHSFNSSAGNAEGKENDGGAKSDVMPSNPQDSTANSSSTLSPSERQDLQNKITKLLAMLDEVDRRYKQYYHQMQIVVSSFDVIAGCGAAKPYTALALQTISRHFRCLRDAINGQIRSTRKSLGEEDSSSSKGGGISRLRYIDQQIRQQRAMQHLGMMQPHAWRPQRGLPETSVSILRAWLFEHFLHPYPKDSEKLMLARQTGLTRSQVSNWFINARVRLWKPMIEEMYKEETGDPEMDSNSSSGNLPKVRDEIKTSEDREDLSPAAERSHTSQLNESSTSNLVPEANVDQPYMNQKLRDQRPNREDSSLLHDVLDNPNAGGRFMAYHQMAEFGRYGNGGVSLTLGLQHPDGGLLGSNSQQGFLSVRGEDIYGTAPSLGPDAGDYDCINLMDRRQRFGPSHILHDFVA